MNIYIIEGYKDDFPEMKGRKRSDRLIKSVMDLEGYHDIRILRTERGKPVPEDGSVHISVSHTGNLFLCVISQISVGIDIQIKKKIDLHKICRRHFTDDEKEYIMTQGSDAFFKIWVRKEAYAKCTGTGIRDVLDNVSVIGEKEHRFIDFQLSDNIYGSCCRGGK